MMGRGICMKHALRRFFVLVSVFLLCANSAHNLRLVQSQEQGSNNLVDIVIDEGQEDLSSLFDSIDRFTQYGLAKVSKQVGVFSEEWDGYIIEHPIIKYGLINTKGELVLDVIYNQINDYDENYYEVYIEHDYQYTSGLVSKRTGEIIIEPKYSWLPNLFENNYAVLHYVDLSEEQHNYYAELFTTKDNIIKKAELPTELSNSKVNWFWINELSENLYMVNASVYIDLSEELGLGAGGYGFDTRWLTDSELNIINIDGISNIQEVFTYNDLTYILTYEWFENNPEKSSSANIYVGEIIDGVYEYETIASDVPYAWYNRRNATIEYAQSHNNWRMLEYNLETQTVVMRDDWNNQSTFEIRSIPNLVFRHNCNNDDFSCSLEAFEKNDSTHTNNLFEGKNVSWINYLDTSTYELHLSNNKKNIFRKSTVNGSDAYFYLLENDYDGWAYIEDDMLTLNNWINDTNFTTVINIKDVSSTILSESDRYIVNNLKDTWSYSQGKYLFVQTYNSDNGTFNSLVMDMQLNKRVLDSVKDLSVVFYDDMLYGSYEVASKRQGFIYDGVLRFLNASWFTLFNDYGFSKYYLNESEYSVEGIIDRNGRVIVEANQVNPYYDYDGQGNHVFTSFNWNTIDDNYIYESYYHYLDNMGELTTYGPYSEYVRFEKNKPTKLKNSDSEYLFIKDNQMLTHINENLKNAIHVSDYLGGYITYSKESGGTTEKFVISETEGPLQIDAAAEVVGRFVSFNNNDDESGVLTVVKYIESIDNEVINYLEVDEIFTTFDNVRVVSDTLYLQRYENDGQWRNRAILVNLDNDEGSKFSVFESVTIDSISYDVQDVYEFSPDDDATSTDGFYLVRVQNSESDSRVGVIDGNGNIIISPIHQGVYAYKDYFIIENGENNNSLYSRSGDILLRDANGDEVTFNHVELHDEKFLRTYAIDLKDNTNTSVSFYLDEHEFKYLGEFYLEKIENTELFRYQVYDLESDQSYVGIINSKGDTVISHLEKYNSFELDKKNQLIIPWGWYEDDLGNQVSLGGLFDIQGNVILPKDYQIELDYDSREIAIDKNGFVRVNKNNVYKQYYFDDAEQQWESHQLGTTNIFHLATRKLVFDSNIVLINKLHNNDSFYHVNRVEVTDEEFSTENAQQYGDNRVVEIDGIEYILKTSLALYSDDFEEVVPFGDYNSIEVFENNEQYFKVTISDGSQELTGISNQRGVLVVEPKYNFIEYIKEWNLYIFNSQIIDEHHTIIHEESLVVDANFESIFENSYHQTQYNFDMEWLILSNREIMTTSENEEVDVMLTGFYDLKSKTLVEPQFEHINYHDNSTSNAYVVRKINGVKSIQTHCLEIFNGEEMVEECWQNIDYDSSYGIIRKNGEYLLEPIYGYISEPNSQNYATFGEIKEIKYFDEYYEEEFIIYNRINAGLVSLDSGVVVEPKYSRFEPTEYSRDHSDPPIFDKNNHIKVIIENMTETDWYYRVGLIDKQGEVVEPKYHDVYFLDGNYYMRATNGSWIIRNAVTNQEININLDELEVYVSSIEMLDDYFIIESKEFTEFGEYSDYAVFTKDLEPHIDFGHSSIRFDGTYWYLEKYNELFNAYQYAVMNTDLEYLVPFENKYDSLGEYVGGYAIGQSGQRQSTQEQDEDESLFNMFFTKVSANEDDDFVLDILNEQGQVVGDLSDKYDSVTLLGMDGDDVKALVVIDGKYYIGTLVTNEVEEEEIIEVTSIDILQSTISLKVGQTAQLDGVILPINYTESVSQSWSSDDESVAVVDGKGLVKAVGVGTTKINFLVNDFVASTMVTVSAQYAAPQPLDDAQQNFYNQLVNALNGDVELTDEQWLDLLTTLVDNMDLLLYFNDEQSERLEEVYLRVFADNLTYNFDNGDNLIDKAVGFILASDLQSLLDKKQVVINVKIVSELLDTDKQQIDSFISSRNYDDTLFYSFDATFAQTIDGLSVEPIIVRPVMLRKAIPDYLMNQGNLQAITIHNGILEEMVVETKEGAFILRSDKFSAFSVFAPKPAPSSSTDDPVIEDNDTGSISYLWWILALIAALLAGGVTLFVKNKKEVVE